MPDSSTRARCATMEPPSAGAAASRVRRRRLRTPASHPSATAVSTGAESFFQMPPQSAGDRTTTFQTSVPGGYQPLIAISAGTWHSCAIRTDGSAFCWGNQGDGRTDAPFNMQFSAISAGNEFTCALDLAGAPVCWGSNRYDQASPPVGERFTSISSGDSHTCGIHLDGIIICWGRDNYDQASPPGGQFIAISSGGKHSCALRLDGTPVCWGEDTVLDVASSPIRTEEFSSIASGDSHVCALRVLDREPVCWGSDRFDQAWPPFKTSTPTPTHPQPQRHAQPRLPGRRFSTSRAGVAAPSGCQRRLRLRQAELVAIRIRTDDETAELVVDAGNESSPYGGHAPQSLVEIRDLDVEVHPVLA